MSFSPWPRGATSVSATIRDTTISLLRSIPLPRRDAIAQQARIRPSPKSWTPPQAPAGAASRADPDRHVQRAGEAALRRALTQSEKIIHEQGLVSVLRQLHDDLDAAVFDAYGWPAPSIAKHSGCALTDEEILERLVALNAERAAEEAQGLIRWLRPEYQAPTQHAVRNIAAAGLDPRNARGSATRCASPPPLARPHGRAGAGRARRAGSVGRPGERNRSRRDVSRPRRRIVSPSCWKRWSRWARRGRRPRGSSWDSRRPLHATEPQATRIGCCTGGFSSKLSAPRRGCWRCAQRLCMSAGVGQLVAQHQAQAHI